MQCSLHDVVPTDAPTLLDAESDAPLDASDDAAADDDDDDDVDAATADVGPRVNAPKPKGTKPGAPKKKPGTKKRPRK